MPSTKHPIEAFDYAKRLIKNMPLEQVFPNILNRVAYMHWTHAAWRWTVGNLPSFNLVNSTFNYTIAYPADYSYAISARVSDGNKVERDLAVVPLITTTPGYIGQPNRIAFLGAAGDAAGAVRVSPAPAAVSGTQAVLSMYKKAMTPFTRQTMFTAYMPFPDEWFWVFEEGVLWQSYLYGDDSRAGDASVSKDGQVQYSGQRAVFEAALITMKSKEPGLIVNPFMTDGKGQE